MTRIVRLLNRGTLPLHRLTVNRLFASNNGSPIPKHEITNQTSTRSKFDGNDRIRQSPITWASMSLVGFVGACLTWYYTNEKEKRMTQTVSQVTSVGKPNLGGPWTLVNMDGIPKTDKDYLGTYILLYFGFAHCPDICPAELVKLGHILEESSRQLKRIVPVKPIFISVDPDRDSLRQLRLYAKDFHPSIDYLTGTKDQVAKVARAYRVYFSKTNDHEDDEDYLVDHSIVMYLVNDKGEFVDFYTQRMGVSDCVDRLVKELKSNPSILSN